MKHSKFVGRLNQDSVPDVVDRLISIGGAQKINDFTVQWSKDDSCEVRARDYYVTVYAESWDSVFAAHKRVLELIRKSERDIGYNR